MLRKTSFTDHYYRSADDRLDLYARDYNDGADATPILMMHGLTRNSADFEGIADQLRKHHRLIVPDQRGRGRSDYDNQAENYLLPIYVQDMFALLQSLGIDKVILLGTSMGGLIAIIMAAMQPERITGIILNDIGPQVQAEGLERLQTYVGKSNRFDSWESAALYSKSNNAHAFPHFTQADWLAFARRTCREDADGKPVLAYDMAISASVEGTEPTAAPPDIWPLWQSLKHTPALVLRGETSDILSAETMRKMGLHREAAFSSVELKNIGHAPMLDEQESIAAIQNFLASI